MKLNKLALVTGGAGFVGSWLCDRLLEMGLHVICVDNLASGNRRNIANLFTNKKFKFVEYDVTKPMNIRGAVNYVFNLASRASPVDFKKYAIDILLANSTGTRNALELARQKKARLLLASSSEVYGDPLEHPQKEEYRGNVSTTGPRSPYDEAKRFGEALASAYHKTHGMDIRIARIFNTYGPRMRNDDGRVIPNFITQALKGRPITVYGDGSQTRSFCYIDDLIDGISKLMFVDGLGGEVVNLGNPDEINVLEVAKLVKKLTGSTSKIVFKHLPQDDPIRRRPELSRAKRLFGWKPAVSLVEGLGKTIEYSQMK